MAIIIEDGTLITDANCYATEAELVAYALARGVTLVTGAEELLIKAMDYIEAQPFKGSTLSYDQELQWPRYEVMIDGYAWPSTLIPKQLKRGLLECAIQIDAGNNPLDNIDRATKSEKLGDLEVEYMDSAKDTITLTAVDSALKKLVKSASFIVPLMRA